MQADLRGVIGSSSLPRGFGDGQLDWRGKKVCARKQCDFVNFVLFTQCDLGTGSLVYHFLIDFFWKERVSVSSVANALSAFIGHREQVGFGA